MFLTLVQFKVVVLPVLDTFQVWLNGHPLLSIESPGNFHYRPAQNKIKLGKTYLRSWCIPIRWCGPAPHFPQCYTKSPNIWFWTKCTIIYRLRSVPRNKLAIKIHEINILPFHRPSSSFTGSIIIWFAPNGAGKTKIRNFSAPLGS